MRDDKFFDRFSKSITVENLCQRVRWLIFFRWLAGIGVVVCVLTGKSFFNIHKITVPLILGIGILFYNAVFHVITKYCSEKQEEFNIGIQKRIFLINLQIFIDLVVLATLIYFTGGITNPFLFFFIFHMVISSILLSRRNAFFWVFFTIIIQSFFFCLEHFHVIPSIHFFPFYPEGLASNRLYVLLLLGIFSITLIITVYFATSIMRPIRKHQLDLTDLKNDLKEQRDQLEMKNKELEELDHSKTEFLYRVEHELKAPIGALQGLLSVVSRGYSSVDDEKKKELLGRAENRVFLMKELVTDLLSLSRISEKSFELELEEIQFEKIVQIVLNDLSFFSKKKGISIKTNLSENLPPIKADPKGIHEIVMNLIHNAVKYSFQGEVLVSLYQQNDLIVFEVKDSGIGISEEDINFIFNEFYRTPNAKALEEGSGLGLSLVKRLVERHKGHIEVRSELNKGTTFTVYLPFNGTQTS